MTFDRWRADRGQPTSKGVRLATGTLVAGLVGLVASLLVLGFIADEIHEQEALALDAWATPFLHSIASPGLDAVMNTLTTLGSALVVVPLLLVAAALLLVNRRPGAALFLVVLVAGARIVDATMKVLFERPRPKLDYATVLPDYSFPSGHSMTGVVFYVGLALVLWSIFGRRIGLPATVLAAVLALGIGISRIYLGYHYLSDVGGGLLAGIAWLLVVAYAFRASLVEA